VPFFSIIIPTFNAAKTIGKCLESIGRQDYTNYEVLIIDGLSNDTTLDILESYQAKIPGLSILSEKDRGIYDAMNKGIRLAKGEWLYFLGSDDTLYDHGTLKSLFDLPGLSKCNVLYGNVLIQGNAGWAIDGAIFDGEYNLSKLLKGNICHQAILYRKSFIRKHQLEYNIRYPVLADWDFNIHCWALTDFYYIDKIIARFNGGGISTAEKIADDFNDEFVKNFISYFNIDHYNKLIDQIPEFRRSQLLVIRNESRWVSKIKKVIKRVIDRVS
jgi:glycosyltransferase involved in cell wall biosynthesis